jgi:hypothetical protein
MEFFVMLENTWPAQLVANSAWGFPILEIVHLSGVTVVFGGMVCVDFRLLGFRSEFSVLTVERYILRFVWGGFAVAAFSGGWLVLYEATTLARDPAFLLKMVLIPTAGLNALFMQKIAMRDVERWERSRATPLAVKISAAASLLLWLSVLACGRLIAYYYPY